MFGAYRTVAPVSSWHTWASVGVEHNTSV